MNYGFNRSGNPAQIICHPAPVSKGKVPALKYQMQEAINRDPSLSPSTRRVAGELLSHLNGKTQLCRPSAERLAGLLGLSMRTVRRAISKLCEPGGYFIIVRRGKTGRANVYAPDWARVTGLTAQDDRMRPNRVTASSPQPTNNPLNRTLGVTSARKPAFAAAEATGPMQTGDGFETGTINQTFSQPETSAPSCFAGLSAEEQRLKTALQEASARDDMTAFKRIMTELNALRQWSS